ncbi:hypothetical protein GQR60_15350 [Labilibaculum sp. A4]|uniref:Twin-arginine translocation signal domain-containing protein n=1 Tax=Labilibaculum euxinus TaxID=2686357 RepID=A0A425Y798_9BACT|nr:hypothetical protein [Labilibaculum euxinus]MDQ1771814.1 hypothetical protein [Labilibaculum euxinus]MUP38550.1 hypothetical protein [Labilibaculum euxinus]MVB07755.1 hypothetical protein [Labilibaculum euxinus]MWN77717.1 hypothetical protein [Labilibaculum euxinus]
MSNQNSTRRGFFQKLGLTVGAAALIETEALADINLNRFSSEEDRNSFLLTYETWVNDYIEVVEKEKLSKSDISNKHRIMELSDQASGWQEQIKEYLQHDDFKNKYISLSKKFAESITPELEA